MNTAERLLGILDAVTGTGTEPSAQAARAWGRAMGLMRDDGQFNDDEVVLALQAFRAELESVEALLAARGTPENLYRSQFLRIRNAASPTTMHQEWRGMVGNINPPDVRLPLGWAAYTLPSNESELAANDLHDLAAAFDELAATVEGASLPPVMKAYAAKQLRTLRSALRMYNVRGITVVHEALEQAFGAARKAQAELVVECAAQPAAKTVVDRLNAGIARAMRVCDDVDKARKGGSALLDMASGLQNLLEIIGKST